MGGKARSKRNVKKNLRFGVSPVRVGWLRKKSPKGYIGARPWQARYFVLR